MIPVEQRICSAGGDGVPGDCVKCCVASILELSYEEVPHFVAREVMIPQLGGEPYAADWYSGLNYWLRSSGWPLRISQTTYYKNPVPRDSKESFDWYDPRERPRAMSTDMGYWIASVISENFERSTHAIVMLDGEVAFDPSSRPRQTPYQYVGEMHFIATNPALCQRSELAQVNGPPTESSEERTEPGIIRPWRAPAKPGD